MQFMQDDRNVLFRGDNRKQHHCLTLREIDMLLAGKGQACKPGDRLYNCSNYYVAVRKLEKTPCQMSTARIQAV